MSIIECFKEQTSESAEDSLESEVVYLFGVRLGKSKVIGMDNPFSYDKLTKLGNFFPNIHMGVNPLETISASFGLVNGLPLRWVYGNVTEITPDQKRTILNSTDTSGVNPRLAIAQELGTKEIAYGIGFSEITLKYMDKSLVVCELYGKGCKKESYAYTLETPIYPSDQGDLFNTHKYLKWNSNEIDVVSVEFKGVKDISGNMGDSGYFSSLNDNDSIMSAISFTTYDYDANLYADYIAKTPRRLQWRFIKKNNVDSYIELDTVSATAYIYSYTPIRTDIGELIGYNTLVVFENITFEVNDYVDSDFYTIPT
jgi:hypothetical protein